MWRELAGVGLWRVGVGGEAAEQALDGGEVDPGLGVLLGVLVVLGEAPAPAMPSDRAFHRPSPRHDREAGLPLGAPHHLDADAELPLRPLGERAAVVAVAEDQFQLGRRLGPHRQQLLGRLRVREVGRRHERADQIAGRVGQDVPLAAADPFSARPGRARRPPQSSSPSGCRSARRWAAPPGPPAGAPARAGRRSGAPESRPRSTCRSSSAPCCSSGTRAATGAIGSRCATGTAPRRRPAAGRPPSGGPGRTCAPRTGAPAPTTHRSGRSHTAGRALSRSFVPFRSFALGIHPTCPITLSSPGSNFQTPSEISALWLLMAYAIPSTELLRPCSSPESALSTVTLT